MGPAFFMHQKTANLLTGANIGINFCFIQKMSEKNVIFVGWKWPGRWVGMFYRVDLENYENLFAGYWENRCGLYSGGN